VHRRFRLCDRQCEHIRLSTKRVGRLLFSLVSSFDVSNNERNAMRCLYSWKQLETQMKEEIDYNANIRAAK